MNDRDTNSVKKSVRAAAVAILGAAVFAGLIVHTAVTNDADAVDIVIMAGVCLVVLGAGLTIARQRPGRNTSVAAVYAEEFTGSDS